MVTDDEKSRKIFSNNREKRLSDCWLGFKKKGLFACSSFSVIVYILVTVPYRQFIADIVKIKTGPAERILRSMIGKDLQMFDHSDTCCR
jgi:hypothetical protein